MANMCADDKIYFGSVNVDPANRKERKELIKKGTTQITGDKTSFFKTQWQVAVKVEVQKYYLNSIKNLLLRLKFSAKGNYFNLNT